MSQNHLQTPYSAEYAEGSDALLISAAPNAKGWGVEICTVADEGTAAFIVKACNSHAKLVEALEEIANTKTLDENDYHYCGTCVDLVATASRALQQLKESE